MDTPEKAAKEILDTIDPFVNEWVDSSMDDMRKDLLDAVTEIYKSKVKPGLPDYCVLEYDEVKFCSIRNGDGWQCKRCAN